MKVGLIDVDGHGWPNLCQMKLSAYHKNRGDFVERWMPEGRYDVVYKSRVFTDLYTKDTYNVTNAEQVICGGTGYGSAAGLPYEVEHSFPDYGLYPEFPDTAYGFLTRGCPRRCGFCIVSKKEGAVSHKVADLSEFWDGQHEIKLLDPNLLACADHEDLLVQLADSRACVDFSQGLDIRLITPENAALLNKIRVKRVHFAWDNPEQDFTGHFQRFSELSKIRDHRRKAVYVLTNWHSTHEQDLWRVYTLRELGYSPYVMVYDKPHAPPITRQLQRWVNNKRIFNTVRDFENYQQNWRGTIESKKDA
ncbi:MAG: radical SAM protein [Oscillibacter sp.]|nr:radical SAM protein [Oscillibacter sp.]